MDKSRNSKRGGVACVAVFNPDSLEERTDYSVLNQRNRRRRSPRSQLKQRARKTLGWELLSQNEASRRVGCWTWEKKVMDGYGNELCVSRKNWKHQHRVYCIIIYTRICRQFCILLCNIWRWIMHETDGGGGEGGSPWRWPTQKSRTQF